MFGKWNDRRISAQANSSSSDDAVSTFWLDDPCSSFDFFYNTVFIGSLCLFGITANLLSIVVLYLDRHNRVATFLLRSLAVADVSVLVIFFVVMSIFFGTHSVPGFYVQYTRYAIPYLKKVYSICVNTITQNCQSSIKFYRPTIHLQFLLAEWFTHNWPRVGFGAHVCDHCIE